MRDLWRTLDGFAASSPKPLRLLPPASERAIRAAEKTIGIDFPPDYRASLLVHDGQATESGDDDTFDWLPGQPSLVCLDRVIAEWESSCQTAREFYGDGSQPPELIEGDRLYSHFWNARRIPIAGNAHFDQDNTYLDFFPGPKGERGQLVMFGKGVYGAWVGPSFGASIEIFVNGLEKGEWQVDAHGTCVPRNKRMSWYRYVEKKAGLRP